MQTRIRRLLEKTLKKYYLKHGLIPKVRHMELSYVLSLDDDNAGITSNLIKASLAAINIAADIDLSDIANRFDAKDAKFINTWPGEHYRLLSALVKTIAPKKVIEIGTFRGASYLSIKKYLPNDATIITYDIIPWNNIGNTGLRKNDFDEKHQQVIMDLCDKDAAKSQIPNLEEAEFIFVDAEKDGKMEKRICDLFDSISFHKPPIILFDDIRLINMIKIWREINHPKLDLTSFGHWSGTGIVEWK